MREETINLGMPHMAYRGLSEDWLLKTLGHAHWCLIAQALGQTHPTFKDKQGHEVYAAFCAIDLSCPLMAQVALNDVFVIRSTLYRASPTRLLSDHLLVSQGQVIGRCQMISVFVKRAKIGDNKSVARVDIPLEALENLPPHYRQFVDETAQEAKHIRMNDYGHESSDADYRDVMCSATDFNRAGLLYFPSYVRFAEKALYAQKVLSPFSVVEGRRIIFCGNVNPFEALRCYSQSAIVEGGKMQSTQTIRAESEQIVCRITSSHQWRKQDDAGEWG